MAGTYVEISKSEHDHGGLGWEFGTCLWSPRRNKSGADRYSLMREPERGDRVVHIYRTEYAGLVNTFIIGESRVSAPCREVDQEPPSPGHWPGMGLYYRIDLESYSQFPTPLSIPLFLNNYEDELRRDLADNSPSFYPFNTHGVGIRVVQGIYLARCTAGLEDILARALGVAGAGGFDGQAARHEEYRESRRLASERYFFARNHRLVSEAKRFHGHRCQLCEMSFAETYPALGEGYIEVHHVDPLSERDVSEWTEELTTSIDGVMVVCGNCHRMIHHRRPALHPDEVRAALLRGS